MCFIVRIYIRYGCDRIGMQHGIEKKMKLQELTTTSSGKQRQRKAMEKTAECNRQCLCNGVSASYTDGSVNAMDRISFQKI